MLQGSLGNRRVLEMFSRFAEAGCSCCKQLSCKLVPQNVVLVLRYYQYFYLFLIVCSW